MVPLWTAWPVIGVALVAAIVWAFPKPHAAIVCTAYRLRWRLCMGCCTNCDGTGGDSSAPETNGMCWDCYGTGHCHP